ncbi:MAG: hypothetical protein HYX24_04180 [Candidatus Aenigmarchaeota archaeon]|nr:hypothetical protein [Candidatus Aenigmarchaeota archaeon]
MGRETDREAIANLERRLEETIDDFGPPECGRTAAIIAPNVGNEPVFIKNISNVSTALPHLGFTRLYIVSSEEGLAEASSPPALAFKYFRGYAPTKRGMEDCVSGMGKAVKQGDILAIYMTGHGYRSFFGKSRMTLENGTLTDRALARMLHEALSQKEPIGRIVVADQCYGLGFVRKLESEVYRGIAASEEGTSDRTFSRAFFRALIRKRNLKGAFELAKQNDYFSRKGEHVLAFVSSAERKGYTHIRGAT